MEFKTKLENGHLTFKGKSFQEAIENNIKTIVKAVNIGNDAGYRLEGVWAEPDADNMLLHIIGCGNDGVIGGYDPINDKPKTVTLTFYGLPSDQLKPFECEFKEDVKFNPLEDDFSNNDNARIGVAMSIYNEIGEKHCDEKIDIATAKVSERYPNLHKNNIQKYFSVLDKTIEQHRPLNNEYTKKLLARARILSIYPDNVHVEISPLYLVYKSKAALYFEYLDKITALEYYRKKARLTQQQLADKIGISARQVQNYEGNGSNLHYAKYYVVEKIADVLGCKTENLVKNGQTCYLKQ